jgi:hypothetical protein
MMLVILAAVRRSEEEAGQRMGVRVFSSTRLV